MDVRLSPDLGAKIDRWAVETGRPADELVEEAVVGYLDELAQLRGMLDGRYNDLKSGRVSAIGGAEALARLQEKQKASRAAPRG